MIIDNATNLDLKKVTLVAVSSVKIGETVEALKRSMVGIDYYDVVLVTHQKPENIVNGITFKKCDQIKSLNEYSEFMLYKLSSYIDSDFALVVQYDGYVLRPNKWIDNFFNYDYIGAPWHKGDYMTIDGVSVRVVNGGFSFRSKKLLDVFNVLKIPFTDHGSGSYNEDGAICVYCRRELENYGIKFAPVSVASVFSREEQCSDSEAEPFGFHLFKNVPHRKLKNFIKSIFRILRIELNNSK